LRTLPLIAIIAIITESQSRSLRELCIRDSKQKIRTNPNATIEVRLQRYRLTIHHRTYLVPTTVVLVKELLVVQPL
jgi:hypothetical protein